MNVRFLLYTLALSTLFVFSFCQKTKKRAPLVTSSVSSPGVVDAYFSGVLYSAGDAAVSEKGVCYGLQENITIDNSKVICETDEQNFTAHLTNLTSDTRYYARAYAKNKFGTSYGKVLSFDTRSINFPNLNLNAYYSPGVNFMDLSLQLIQNLPSSFTAGICWSKNHLPTILNSTVQVTARAYTDYTPYNNIYYNRIVNLDESTTYYARAYAIGEYGTIYSNEVSWTTATPVNPIVFSLQSVVHTSASFNVAIVGFDNSLIKNTGVCWSESPQPTTSSSKIERSGVSQGVYNIGALKNSTTYYVRAYIITNTKVIYGVEQKVIRTLKGTVLDVDGNEYNTVEIGGQEWMTSNLRVGSFNNGTAIPLVSNYNQWVNYVNAQVPAYCYYGDQYNNNEPYGKLYPRYVAQNPNLAPVGWRVATVDDWNILLANVNLPNLCINNGDWGSDAAITNHYGFSLYPAGYWDSGYGGMGYESRIWATPSSGSTNNVIVFTSYNSYSITWLSNGDGNSVRCIKQ